MDKKIEEEKVHYRTACGVELGVGRMKNGETVKIFVKGHTHDTGRPVVAHGIYLRRPRIGVDDDAEEGRDHNSQSAAAGRIQEGHVPRIFLQSFIPGDIDIGMTTYDAHSMKNIDKTTWEQLQSTHKTMEERVKCTLFWLIMLWLGLAFAFLAAFDKCKNTLGISLVVVFLVVSGMIIYTTSESRRFRRCEETARIVREAIQQHDSHDPCVVEFHTSHLPGREPWCGWNTFSPRYEIVTPRDIQCRSFEMMS